MSTVTGRGRERRDCQTMKCCIVHGAVIHSTRRMPRATPSNQATHRDCRTCDVHHRRRADAHRVHAARRSPREHNASTVLGIAAIPAGIRPPQTSSPSRRPPRSRHTASTSTSLSRLSAPSLALQHGHGRLHRGVLHPHHKRRRRTALPDQRRRACPGPPRHTSRKNFLVRCVTLLEPRQRHTSR